jgi:hypothetical protein
VFLLPVFYIPGVKLFRKSGSYQSNAGWCFLSKMLSTLVIASKNKKAHRIKPCWTAGHSGFLSVQPR